MAPSDSEADRPELDAPAMHGRKLHGRLEGNPKPASWPTARRIETNPAAMLHWTASQFEPLARKVPVSVRALRLKTVGNSPFMFRKTSPEFPDEPHQDRGPQHDQLTGFPVTTDHKLMIFLGSHSNLPEKESRGRRKATFAPT
jgi:hypothetical protein